MAEAGPSAARRSPSRKPSRSASTTGVSSHDPYYGHEETAKICAHFVTHLFSCPPNAPPTSNLTTPPPALPFFIAYALHRTRLHSSVTFAALYLLQRLKTRFPAARGSSGHRLFISAFMISSKVICDDTYSNKSWAVVGQAMFALREVNQMEREMCSYLEWQLNVEPQALKEFEAKVRRDFKGAGPYPSYTDLSPAPTPVPGTTPYASSEHAIFATKPSSEITPPPMPAYPDREYPSPPKSPSIPATPDASHSTSTSPASSITPSTPVGWVDENVRVVIDRTVTGSPETTPTDTTPTAAPPMKRKTSSLPAEESTPASKKPTKLADKVYARAVPALW